MNVPESEELKHELKNQLVLFKRFCTADRRSSMENKLDRIEFEVVIDSDNYNCNDMDVVSPSNSTNLISSSSTNPIPNIMKTFVNLRNRMKRERNQEIYDKLIDFLENDGELSVSVTWVSYAQSTLYGQ